MPGGILQLINNNQHNEYISGNPQITFFKSVYKKYTNFAIECIDQSLEGDLSLGNIIECKIDKYYGDLLHDMYLEIELNLTLDSTYNYYSIINYCYNIIDYVEIEIGNTIIDKHYGKWMQIWNELTEDNTLGFNGLVSLYTSDNENISENGIYHTSLLTKSQQMSGNGIHKILKNAHENISNQSSDNSSQKYFNMNYRNYGGGNTFYEEDNMLKGRIFIPFNFWFCNKPGLAIPLLCLFYDDIHIRIKLNEDKNIKLDSNYTENSTIYSNDTNYSFSDSYIHNNGILTDDSNIITDISNYKLWCEYIYIDEDEKSKFVNSNHLYLIEQLQYQQNTINHNNGLIQNEKIDLRFNHTIKELIWTFQRNNPLYETELLSPLNYDGDIEIFINEHSRFEKQNIFYFTRYQPYRYHTGRGGINHNDSIYVYSFSLFPEKFQPSGICNFDNINVSLLLNNISILCDNDSFNINIYAINYNILQFSGGSVKLLYGK